MEEKKNRVPIRQLIVEARLRLGLTQKQLADGSGITQSTLSRFESGLITSIDPNTLTAMHRAITDAAVKQADERTASDPGAPVLNSVAAKAAARDGFPPAVGQRQVEERLKAIRFLSELDDELQAKEAEKAREQEAERKLLADVRELESKARQFDALHTKLEDLERRIVHLEQRQVKKHGPPKRRPRK